MELSIVLVIIGLLAGSIVAGRAMIHNGELKTIVADQDRFKKAIIAFKQKYNYLPGDLPTAQNYWGVDSNGCPGTANHTLPASGTCNGNGDGFIGDSGSTPIGTINNVNETYRMWQQLAMAGFIEGSYTGALSDRVAGQALDLGMNIPQSGIRSNGYSILYAAPVANGTLAGVFGGNYHHIMVYGQPVQVPGHPEAPTYMPGITPNDAFLIDQKLDDGKPGSGNVMTYTSAFTGTPSCLNTANGTDENNAAYQISYTAGQACSLIFILGF